MRPGIARRRHTNHADDQTLEHRRFGQSSLYSNRLQPQLELRIDPTLDAGTCGHVEHRLTLAAVCLSGKTHELTSECCTNIAAGVSVARNKLTDAAYGGGCSQFPPQRRNLLHFCRGPVEPARHSECSCVPSLLWLRRSPHQLIECEPMVVGRVDSPEGAKVNQSIAMLLLPTALFGSAIWARTNSRLLPVASDMRISHGRVAR